MKFTMGIISITLGTAKLKTIFPECKSLIAATAGARADSTFADGDKIHFGSRYVTVISTPGHTDVSLSPTTSHLAISLTHLYY
jgi:hypothetical protein